MSPQDFIHYDSLGALIKAYRQWRGLSQDTFADSIRVSVRQLRRWEAGLSHAGLENLQDISEVTGIPLEACIALNAGQALWYSLSKRRYAYTMIEADLVRVRDLFKSPGHFDEGLVLRNERISTNHHIFLILACHRDTYGAEKPLETSVIEKACKILPDLNCIIFDQWNHYVGHILCLPLSSDTYRDLMTQKSLEAKLAAGNVSDIAAAKNGVFFHYSIFSASLSVGYAMIVANMHHLSTVETKENFLASFHVATRKGKEFFDDLQMRTVWQAAIVADRPPETAPEVKEIELDILMERIALFNPLEGVLTGPPSSPAMLERSGFADLKKNGQTKGNTSDTISATANSEATTTPPPTAKNPAAVALGRLGGLKGGKARAKKLSAEQRRQIARTAALKRWSGK